MHAYSMVCLGVSRPNDCSSSGFQAAVRFFALLTPIGIDEVPVQKNKYLVVTLADAPVWVTTVISFILVLRIGLWFAVFMGIHRNSSPYLDNDGIEIVILFSGCPRTALCTLKAPHIRCRPLETSGV